ncbi:MAG: phospholipase [Planctomycetota bacterium]
MSDFQRVPIVPSSDRDLTSVGGGHVITLPMHHEPGYAYPLIVWLHHTGHNEHQIEQVLPHISLRNYAAVGVRGTRATDAKGHGFDWPARTIHLALRRVAGAVASIQTQCRIHSQRIILAGYRSGATMACRIAMRMPRCFGGVIMMDAPFPATGFDEVDTPTDSGHGDWAGFKELRARRMPMLWQQAIENRPSNPVETPDLTDQIHAAQKIQARVEVRQYTQEVMNTVALKDIDHWIMEQVVARGGSDNSDANAVIMDESNPWTPRSFSVN